MLTPLLGLFKACCVEVSSKWITGRLSLGDQLLAVSPKEILDHLSNTTRDRLESDADIDFGTITGFPCDSAVLVLARKHRLSDG
jgi:hypothetical protein